MAHQIATLALVFFAIVGLTAAASTAPAVSQASNPSNDVIGNTDSGSDAGDDAVAGPVGGPVPDGVFGPTPNTGIGAPGPAPSGSTTIKFSAATGVTAAAVAAVFF